MTAVASDFPKDAGEVLDYTFDWSRWLEAGETISTSVITATSGLALDSQANTETRATAVVSGGTSGFSYALKNTIITTLARTAVRTITIRVTTR